MNDVADDVIDLQTAIVPVEDASLAIGLSRAEIDTQISTARRYPRDLTSVQKRLLSYVTLDEETAEECMYALPRGGKPITGPSVRFAEALKASFGNCRAAARVVHVDRVEKVVIAEGIFHDLETNSASKAEIRRRICDRRGRIYTDDMIIVTGNAACAIALRNAVLAGVPKPVWRRAYETVQRTITGDVKTLSITRDKAVKALAAFGVTPEQIYTAIDVAGMDDMTVEHIPILRGMFSALKNGESTVEEMFVGTVQKTASHKKVENPLSDEEPTEPDRKPEERLYCSICGKSGFASEGFRDHLCSESEAAGSTAPEAVVSAEASASPADANGAADTLGTPAAPQDEGGETQGHAGHMATHTPAPVTGTGRPLQEIAGEVTTPVSGAEARAAGEAQGSGGGLPSSPNIFDEYSAYLSGATAQSPRDFKREEQKFWLTHEYPSLMGDEELKAKFSRIYAIHLNLRTKQIDADQFTAQIREAVAS